MRVPVAALALLVTACAHPSGGPTTATTGTGQAFKPSTVRQPAVFIRVEIGVGQFSERQVASFPQEYEGALVEALNARAIPARDVRLVSVRDKLDPKAALARAREVGADHVFLVNARVQQTDAVFCRDTRRPFRARTAVWSQRLVVLRTSDGARAFETLNPVEVQGVDPDCDAPKDSRPRSASEHITAAVEALLARLLSP